MEDNEIKTIIEKKTIKKTALPLKELFSLIRKYISKKKEINKKIIFI